MHVSVTHPLYRRILCVILCVVCASCFKALRSWRVCMHRAPPTSAPPPPSTLPPFRCLCNAMTYLSVEQMFRFVKELAKRKQTQPKQRVRRQETHIERIISYTYICMYMIYVHIFVSLSLSLSPSIYAYIYIYIDMCVV